MPKFKQKHLQNQLVVICELFLWICRGHVAFGLRNYTSVVNAAEKGNWKRLLIIFLEMKEEVRHQRGCHTYSHDAHKVHVECGVVSEGRCHFSLYGGTAHLPASEDHSPHMEKPWFHFFSEIKI